MHLAWKEDMNLGPGKQNATDSTVSFQNPWPEACLSVSGLLPGNTADWEAHTQLKFISHGLEAESPARSHQQIQRLVRRPFLVDRRHLFNVASHGGRETALGICLVRALSPSRASTLTI